MTEQMDRLRKELAGIWEVENNDSDFDQQNQKDIIDLADIFCCSDYFNLASSEHSKASSFYRERL